MTNGEKFIEVFGVGCATYDVMHDITIIHRNGDWWDAEYEGEEEEPCEDFKKKAGVVIEQLRADRDRLEKELGANKCHTKETLKALMADMERIEPNTEDGENIKRTCICMVLEYLEGEE